MLYSVLGLQQPALVFAVRRLNPHLATDLKNYTYLRQGRNYNGQVNARQEYCHALGGYKITRTKIKTINRLSTKTKITSSL